MTKESYRTLEQNGRRYALDDFRSSVRIGQDSRRRRYDALRRCISVLAGVCVLVSAAYPVASAAGHRLSTGVVRRDLALASDDAPDWLKQAAALHLPAYDKSVSAVTLVDENTTTIDADGRLVEVERHAVRILTREGKESALATKVYRTDTEKVRDFQAWLIRPSGAVKRYRKDDVIDQALVKGDVYNEARLKAVDGVDDADPGSVFGYETTVDSRSVFTQFEWDFQEDDPVVASSFALNLPAGWTAESVTFNHAKIEPALSGSSYKWELHDLPHLVREPLSPSTRNLAPRLAVSYFPSDSAKKLAGRSFENWEDVSRWLSELSEPQAVPNDALTEKARSLTGGMTAELDRIRAIGTFVQAIHYVSIQTGVGRGGGYRPHSAVEVFTKSYGDCKDKANLMRTMLQAIGIVSYPVAIYSGDPYHVRKDWASPQQFNHCIIAIKVADDTIADTIVTNPALGRLLIFDPTDDDTPVGDLPYHEQGSYALIVAGDSGKLMRMPETSPEDNLLDCIVEATLNADGSIEVNIKDNAKGQSAASLRREQHYAAAADYSKLIERWIAASVNGAKVEKVEPHDDRKGGRFTLAVGFTAGNYAQLMQGRLLVFKPAIVSRRESLELTAAARKQPVVLRAGAYKEQAKIKLPAGFDVDELPDPVKLKTQFGSYAATYQVKDGYLFFERMLVLQSSVIPTGNYQSVRTFFERVRAAEQAPAVLAKK
jgi:hypothetical protein